MDGYYIGIFKNANILYYKYIEIILADWGDLQEIAKSTVYEIHNLYFKNFASNIDSTSN